jgi:hypothetical protein
LTPDGTKLVAFRGRTGFMIFERNGDAWDIQNSFLDDCSCTIDWQDGRFWAGHAISDDGNTIVGSISDGVGTVHFSPVVADYDNAQGAWVERTSIPNGGCYGQSFGLSGDGLVLSCGNSGSVQVVEYDGNSWSKRGYDHRLQERDEDGVENGTRYGRGIKNHALSPDGSRLVIGYLLSGQLGRVRVLDYNAASNEYAQIGNTIEGADDEYMFGRVCGITGDNSMIAVGADLGSLLDPVDELYTALIRRIFRLQSGSPVSTNYCHHQFPATNYCCRYRHQFFASYRYRRQLQTTAASCYRLPPPVFASYRRQSPPTTAASRYQLLPATAASFCKQFNSMQVLPLRMPFLQVRILQTTSRPITKHYHCQYFPPRSTTAAARYRRRHHCSID